MAKKTFFSSLIIIFLVATGSYLWAEDTPDVTADMTTPAADDLESPACPSSGESQADLPFFDNSLLEDPSKTNMAGCSASYACVHGGSVNCSAPTGTCTSSGQGCGTVICNGQATFCPGGCNGNDWSCAQFCNATYGSLNGYCSGTRCCVCL